MATEVTTGRGCTPIADRVAISPLRPPLPLGSLALKLITQAGPVSSSSCSSFSGISGLSCAVLGSMVMGDFVNVEGCFIKHFYAFNVWAKCRPAVRNLPSEDCIA
jgi:hypothetical protein